MTSIRMTTIRTTELSMKRAVPHRYVAVLATALLACAGAVHAGTPSDYAWRWPLATQGDSAAWQFELTPEIYAALTDRGLRDFEVFNADGQPVPVARLTVDPETQPGVAQVPLPVFALPRRVDGNDDVSLRLERGANGRLSLLQADVAGAAPSTLIDYVLDADLNRDPQRPATVDRLDLQWPEQGDVRVRFAVEGSDDLEHWQTLVDAAAVVSLHQGGAMLQRRDIAFAPTALRYLRLRQLDGDAVPGLQVSARRMRAGASLPQWRRTSARLIETTKDPADGLFYRYALPARLPVGRARVVLAADNTTAQVIVDAQTGDDPAQLVWVPVGRQSVFRLQQGGLRIDNDDLFLTAPMPAQSWRIRSATPLQPTPGFEVAYLPDRFVFLAQGRGPYTLAAGSRRAMHADLPVEEALAPLRERLGPAWTPPVARVGARTAGGGDAAYAPPARPTDWRSILLWALLIGGAAVVAGFALTLLRQKSAQGEG